MELLKMVGMAEKAHSMPEDLSGGQKQRAAIARCLSMEPEIILFDEPTSALDPTMVGEVQAVIRELARKGLTMMIVTHEMSFAREIANRVFYMDDGGIYEDGPPEQIFDNPQKERTIRFIRRLKVHETHITSKDFDFIGLISELEEFGRKNQISQKTIYRMQTAFEEMCVQMILPQLPDEFTLLVTTTYSQKDNQATMQILYSGERFDPHDSDNILSLKMAQHVAESIVYSPIEKDEFTNQIDITIK